MPQTSPTLDAWNISRIQKDFNQSNLFAIVLFLCRDNAAHAAEALNLYVSAYPNDLRNQMLYKFLGEHLLRSNTKDAVKVFKKFAEQFPSNLYALEKLCDAYLAANDKQAAYNTAKQILSVLDKLEVSKEEATRLRVKAEKILKAKDSM